MFGELEFGGKNFPQASRSTNYYPVHWLAAGIAMALVFLLGLGLGIAKPWSTRWAFYTAVMTLSGDDDVEHYYATIVWAPSLSYATEICRGRYARFDFCFARPSCDSEVTELLKPEPRLVCIETPIRFFPDQE